MKYSDRIIGINSGKEVFCGTPEDLTEEKFMKYMDRKMEVL